MPWTDQATDLHIKIEKIHKRSTTICACMATVSLVAAFWAGKKDPYLAVFLAFMAGVLYDIWSHNKFICKNSHLPTKEDLYGA